MLTLRIKEGDEKRCPRCNSKEITHRDIIWQCVTCGEWFQIIITKYEEPDTKPIKEKMDDAT
jgi:ribosomal protein L37AE/L43A